MSINPSVIRKDFPLSSVSSMKTGGIADTVYFPEDEETLISILDELGAAGVSYRLLGNTSNSLLPDHPGGMHYVFTTRFTAVRRDGDTALYAASGAMLTSLSVFARKESLTGLEFAYGIPGTVGGGVFMNAGAYGGQIADVLSTVRVYDTIERKVKELPAAACEFNYRHSLFQKRPELVILGARFSLAAGEEETIRRTCDDLMNRRREKQPLEYPSCGSAFKRPAGYFAGKLIEDCGLKGFSVGGAAISEKHAGFIINKGGASSADVRALIAEVQRRVNERFGVLLEPEIEIEEDNA